MQIARVTSVVSRPLTPDDAWDEADCLCQGKVPNDKAIDYANKEFRERDNRWVWKVGLRYHSDCPIHGCHRANSGD